MGSLIVVVGNSGVGKTALTRALGATGQFSTGLEGHAQRPFQALFKNDRRYALVNQLDYLLLRAEQERTIRAGAQTGILDGGLEMDFFVFTRLFQRKGWLTEDEYRLCERLYRQIRAAQPPPEAVIRLAAPLELVERRFVRRARPLEIAARHDLPVIESLLDDWQARLDPQRLLVVDASTRDPGYRQALPSVIHFISKNSLAVKP
jgi:deoxyadenosine/deoxycytidine kinase